MAGLGPHKSHLAERTLLKAWNFFVLLIYPFVPIIVLSKIQNLSKVDLGAVFTYTLLNSGTMAQSKTQKIQAVEAMINHQFQDPDVLWEALHVPGAIVRDGGGRNYAEGNKRLAFLGDFIMKAALSSQWYTTGDTRGMVPYCGLRCGSYHDSQRC